MRKLARNLDKWVLTIYFNFSWVICPLIIFPTSHSANVIIYQAWHLQFSVKVLNKSDVSLPIWTLKPKMTKQYPSG